MIWKIEAYQVRFAPGSSGHALYIDFTDFIKLKFLRQLT